MLPKHRAARDAPWQRLWRQKWRLALLLSTILLQCACAQRGGPSPIPPAKDNAIPLPEYRFGPEDVLEVSVWKNPDLSREVIVRPDGKISLPLIGDVHAAGLTAEQLSASVTQELDRYHKNPPGVSIIVKQVHGSAIYILGEVETPGRFVVKNGTTVLQALALAGGFTQFAARNKIIVRRKQAANGEIRFDFSYKNVISGKEKNMVLKPEDTIIVP